MRLRKWRMYLLPYLITLKTLRQKFYWIISILKIISMISNIRFCCPIRFPNMGRHWQWEILIMTGWMIFILVVPVGIAGKCSNKTRMEHLLNFRMSFGKRINSKRMLVPCFLMPTGTGCPICTWCVVAMSFGVVMYIIRTNSI